MHVVGRESGSGLPDRHKRSVLLILVSLALMTVDLSPTAFAGEAGAPVDTVKPDLAGSDPVAARLKAQDRVPDVGAATVNISLQPSVEVSGGSEAAIVRLHDALAQFASREMLLPDLEVRFSNDDADCGGNLGIFQRRYSPWRVVVCSELEFVVTHELAHAWEAANLTSVDRDKYLGLRGLTSWSSHELPWKERGEEDAAFVVSKVLMADRGVAESDAWSELIDAFRLLTDSANRYVVVIG